MNHAQFALQLQAGSAEAQSMYRRVQLQPVTSSVCTFAKPFFGHKCIVYLGRTCFCAVKIRNTIVRPIATNGILYCEVPLHVPFHLMERSPYVASLLHAALTSITSSCYAFFPVNFYILPTLYVHSISSSEAVSPHQAVGVGDLDMFGGVRGC